MTAPSARPSPGPRRDGAPAPRPRPGPPSSELPDDVPPRRHWRGRVVVIVVAALAVGLVVANLVLDRSRSENRDTERARVDAVSAARTRIPALLSYTYQDIADYAKRAPTNTTGAFRDHFTDLIAKVVEPAALARHIVTTAHLVSLGVIEAHADSVIVLALVNQTTYGKDSKTATVDGSRARVTMRRAGARWLIAGLTSL